MVSAELRNEIIDMIKHDLTTNDIAAETGLTGDTIRRIAREEGLMITRARRETLEESMNVDVDNLIKDYQAGVGMDMMRQKYGLPSIQSIHAILKRHGVESRRWSPDAVISRQAALETALEMYQDDQPGWLIKQETGVDSTTVLNELHRRGIPLKRQRNRVAQGIAMIPSDELLNKLTEEEKELVARLQERLAELQKREMDAAAVKRPVRPGRR
jgi:transcriptional regulator with XRE-family HTH domain